MKHRFHSLVRNALCASVILGFAITSVSQAQTGCNAFIYGFHDYNNEIRDLLTYQGQRRGWVLVLQSLEGWYGGTNSDVIDAANAGLGVLVRLHWGYDFSGTLPPQSQYGTFASRASQFIQNHINYCRFYQIGNEANLCAEWPSGGAGDGRCKTRDYEDGCVQVREWITADRYANCFQQVYNAIPTGIRSSVKLCVDPTAVWAGVFRCPGNQWDTDDFLCRAQEYYNKIPHYMIGGLAYHPKTEGHYKAQITSDDLWGNPAFGCNQNRYVYKYFWVFKDLLGDIPTALRDRPIFFTELNPHNYGWTNNNNGYVVEAYDEIMDWNATHSDRKITAMMLYRWDDGVNMWDLWDKYQVHADLENAVAKGQTSNGLSICGGTNPTSTHTPTFTPTVPPPSGSNLSQGKTAYASSSYDGNTVAGKAVDGVITSSSKWCSQSQSPSWWYVDLGISAALEQVKVHAAGAGGEPAYMNLRAYTVRASTSGSGDPGTWTQLASYSSGGGDGANVVTHVVSGNYRYVAIHITNSGIDNYARVPEVQVFGAAASTPTNTNTNTWTHTPTNTPTNQVASENFESMPSWNSSHDASWGSAATWDIQSGGQSGNYLRVARGSQGSSAKVKVYTVPTNTSITVSSYMRCPSFSGTYWMEFAYKMGTNTASDFNENGGTWTMIRKYSNDGTNGNGNSWVQNSSSSINTGSNTQISVGFKLGSSGGAGPTVGWDTFRIISSGGGSPVNLATSAVTYVASSQFNTSYRGRNAIDGVITQAGRWVTQNDSATNTLVVDMGRTCSVTGYKMYLASYCGEPSSYNLITFYVESGTSLQGPWTQRWYYNNPNQNESAPAYNHSAINTRYVRLRITNSGTDNYVRLPEFEIYGTPGTLGTIRFEVEDYEGGRQAAQNVEYYDTGTGNTGGQYRSQDVDIETCSEGGWNVGWIYNGEWLLFPFKAPAAGSYQVRIRYAGTGNGTCRVDINDVDKTGSISLPATGGWQTWTTKTGPTISVSAGFQWVKFRMTSSGYNLNYFEFVPQ